MEDGYAFSWVFGWGHADIYAAGACKTTLALNEDIRHTTKDRKQSILSDRAEGNT
jgi:hypothetical protein